MSVTLKSRTRVADDYLKLIREFPLREIRSEKELESAHQVLRKLFLRDESTLTAGENDYLSALSVLVHDYEQRRYPMADDKGSPLERLEYLLGESRTTSAELQKILGVSQSMVSLIRTGKRELSKRNIRRLAEYFKMEAGYFF